MSYARVMEAVAHTAARVGRDPADITVVAVSKGQPAEAVLAVYEMGHRVFGENRAQELAEKHPTLPEDIRWHFVGALQTNKVRVVRPVVTLLHSMDRESLAMAWVKGSGHPPPVLVQVDVAGEPQKAGVAPEDLLDLVGLCVSLGLDVRGLMAIPPAPTHPEDSRPHFRKLQELAGMVKGIHPGATDISMGMTDDFEVAVEEGATIIRVGRAIFGPRQ